jgi:hypothetical protein
MQARNRSDESCILFPGKDPSYSKGNTFASNALPSLRVTLTNLKKEGDNSMKKLLTLTLAVAALIVFAGFGVAQKNEGVNIDPSLEVQSRTSSLPCCECLGKVTTLNINTGQSSPIDPLWKVNGNSAFTTPKVSSWIALNPAQWIQPVASPTPSNNVPPGVYKYTLRFNIPKYGRPSLFHLSGYLDSI